MFIYILFQLILFLGFVCSLFFINTLSGKLIKKNILRQIIKIILIGLLIFIYFKILNYLYYFTLNKTFYETKNLNFINIINNSSYLYPLLLWGFSMYAIFNSFITYKFEKDIKILEFIIDYILLLITILIAFFIRSDIGFLYFYIMFFIMILLKYFLYKRNTNQVLNNLFLYFTFIWIFNFILEFIIKNFSFFYGYASNLPSPAYVDGIFILVMLIILVILKIGYNEDPKAKKKSFVRSKFILIITFLIFFCMIQWLFHQNTFGIDPYIWEIYPSVPEETSSSTYSDGHLSLTGYYIKDLTFFDNVEGLDNVKSLVLDNNNLQSLDGLENFQNLDVLNVTNNNIEEIKGVDFSGIEKVYLSYNNIETLEPSSVEGVEDFYIRDWDNYNRKFDINNLNSVQNIHIPLNQMKLNLNDDFSSNIILDYYKDGDSNKVPIETFNFLWNFKDQIFLDSEEDEDESLLKTIYVVYPPDESFDFIGLHFELIDKQTEQRTYKITNNSSNEYPIRYYTPPDESNLLYKLVDKVSLTIEPNTSETITIKTNYYIKFNLNDNYLIILEEEAEDDNV